ncbi:conserved hypothetical protein [Pedobacter steynii]|uniref:Mucoidy inhibitor MuiA family protein n=1 Tax=Pedobacter steynii TaxID=430522 RepID=A0A1H0LPV3_9SPHI|nr:DUF4139 domain-containing protein [Pedobacter steynii]NQX43540.1 DUF4139 domain-containing protein [Pedobacter steynii]SDO70242.1 conserved hypothetical protein [Pedobacter steynii]
MKRIFLTLITALSITYSYAQSPLSFNSRLESVTVYSTGAELNHKVKVSIPAGTSEIILNNMANAIDESSIQVGVPSSVTILSTSFSRDFLKTENKSPAYIKVEDSLQIVKRELNKVQNKRIVEENLLVLLDKNQAIGGVNTGVNVAELIKVADYYKSKQLELRNNIFSLKEAEAKQQERIDRMQQQLQELSLDKTGTTGQIVLQVMATAASNADFNVSYLSPNAAWIAFYDLRAENTSSPLNIVYKANVTQSTGLDWKKVKLSLSTGNPSQNGTAPLLSAWFLEFGEPQYAYDRKKQAYQNRIQTMEARVPMNKEVMADAAQPVLSQLQGKVAGVSIIQNENMLNASFDIEIPYDIASNSKPHSVTLKEFSQPANFKYYSVPKVDGDAFLMAEITNYDKLNLLPGEANIIFENSYVGKSFIDPNATTDTLNLSMGRDKKITIKREKVAEQTGVKFIGSSKKQTFTYEIRLRNGKKEAVNLLLKDQYPVSTDKDMEVELLAAEGAAINKETGVLTWKLSLKAGATETIRISYSVKYPKDKNILNLQ